MQEAKAPDYYYANTLAAFTRKLGNVERIKNKMGKPTKEHLAWMLEHVTTLNRSSLEDAVKAARWIGWMLLAAEMFGFWSSETSRELIRMDRNAGLDLPKLHIHA